MADATGYRRWDFWAEASLFLGVLPVAAMIAARYVPAVGLPELAVVFLVGPPALFFGWIGRKRTKNGPPEPRIVANLGFSLGFLGFFGCCFAFSGIPHDDARRAARRSWSTNNLKQIGLALHNYHDLYGRFPPSVILDREGRPLYSWRVAILPFLEADDLYREFRLDEPWDGPNNARLLGRMPGAYHSPGAGGIGSRTETPYLAVVGPGTAFEVPEGPTLGDSETRISIEEIRRRGLTFDKANMSMGDFRDGIEHTLLVVSARRLVPWTSPEDFAVPPLGPIPPLGEEGLQLREPFRKSSVGGFNALLADGSVRFIKLTTREAVLRALFSRAGGEIINDDQF